MKCILEFLLNLLSILSVLRIFLLVYLKTMILNTQMPLKYCHSSDFALVQLSFPQC